MLKLIAFYSLPLYLLLYVGINLYGTSLGAVAFGCIIAAVVMGMYVVARNERWLRVTEASRPRVGDTRFDIMNDRQEVFTGMDWSRVPDPRDNIRISREPRISLSSVDEAALNPRGVMERELAHRAIREMDLRIARDMQQAVFGAAGQQLQGLQGMGLQRALTAQELWSQMQQFWPSRFPAPRAPRRADDILSDSISRAERERSEFQRMADEEQRLIDKFRRFQDGGATVAEIHAEANAELRQAMLEKFGLDRYMEEVGAKVIAKDQYGELLEYKEQTRVDVTDQVRNIASFLPIQQPGMRLVRDPEDFRVWMERTDRQVRAVRVLNSTPDWPPERHMKVFKPSVSLIPSLATPDDPDLMECKHRDGYVRTGEKSAVCNSCGAPGEFRTYILRVPPTMRTPQEAIAWTFGLRAEEYQPERMT